MIIINFSDLIMNIESVGTPRKSKNIFISPILISRD